MSNFFVAPPHARARAFRPQKPLQGLRQTLAIFGTILSIAAAGCQGGAQIQVIQGDVLNVVAVDPLNQPIAHAPVTYSKVKFTLGTPNTTPPTPYSLPGDLEEASVPQSTDSTGASQFFFPRHGKTTTADVITVNVGWGNLYAFVLNNNLTVDLVTTVFYEMLAYSTLDPTTLSVSQMQTLQAQAYNVINTAISNFWINPSAPMKQLHRAYQNCLSGNLPFMTALVNASFAAKHDLTQYVAYQSSNVRTQRVGFIPAQLSPFVVEGAPLKLQVSGSDKDGDTVFYNWVVTPTAPSSSGSDLNKGILAAAQIGNNSTESYNFVSDYSTDPWYQASQIVYVTAVFGDGSQPWLQTWAVQVSNKERPPVFTTAAPTAPATEDQMWYYTPAAISPDGAPVKLGLSVFPAGADMCIPSGFYMSNPPANYAGFSAIPTWQWQVAGTPCTQPNLIQWQPNNCESGPVLSPQTFVISAIDPTGAGGTQNLSVRVTDVNTPPQFDVLSVPGPLTITGPTLWTYTPVIDDPETVAPFHAGAQGCLDVPKYTFVTAPTGATIDAVTGAIAWTPDGTQTGPNNFSIKVDDLHGGTAIQNWAVQVNDVNIAPTINLGACPTVAHEAGPVFNGVNYFCGLIVTQWTVNSKFNLTITGGPPGMYQNPTAGFYTTAADIQGAAWMINDTMTVPLPAIASWPINIQVCNDGKSGTFAPLCSTASYTMTAPKEDLPPQFATSPPTQVMSSCLNADCAVIGTNHYTYSAQITDGNVSPPDTFTYTVGQPNPAGQFALTSSVTSATAPTGAISLDWQVNNTTDIGSHVLSITAQSGLAANGGPKSTAQNWTVFVQETNRIPSFSAIPAQTGQDGSLYTYDFKSACSTNATTVPNKNLTFTLSPGAPTGMTINNKTGIVSWAPTADQAKGPQPMSYKVNCLSKLGTPATSTSVTVPVTLTYVNLPPVWSAVPSQLIGANQVYSLNVLASDPDGESVSLSVVSGLPTGATFTSSGGNGILSWTPGTAAVGNYTVVLRATNPVAMQTDLTIHLQVVNAPVVLSHPVVAAKAGSPYHYEMHVLDPVGGGITFKVDTSSPTGVNVTPISGSSNSALVTWSPSNAFSGTQTISIRLTDANNTLTVATWDVNVGIGVENLPQINVITPSTNPVVMTEGLTTTLSVAASDPDGDVLHYAYYWDGTWVNDAGLTYSYTPANSDAGDHTLTIAITDGASADVTQDVPVHVRDAIPVLDKSITTASGLNSILSNSREGQLFASIANGASSQILLYNELNLTGGQIASFATNFAAQRMSIKNNLPSPTDYVLYLAANNDILSGSNTFGTADSTGTFGGCTSGSCLAPSYIQGYAFTGGTQTAFVQSNLHAYFVKSSGARYLGTYTNGNPTADIDLGVGALASEVLYDSSSGKVFVSTGGTNVINVINPTTNTITGTIPGVGTSPSLMALNLGEGKLYVYSAPDGSIAEVQTSTATVNSLKTGFPTSVAIGASPRNLMAENTDDDILYLALPDQHLLVTYDIVNAGISKLTTASGPDEIAFDPVTHLLFAAQYGANVIFKTK